MRYTQKVYVCDICHSEIRKTVLGTRYTFYVRDIYGHRSKEKMDLCSECHTNMIVWLRDAAEKEQHE